MLVKMFKTLFPSMPNTELNKYINKNVRLHGYRNSSIPQICICRVGMKPAKIKLLGIFFIVFRNGSGVLGIAIIQMSITSIPSIICIMANHHVMVDGT